MTTTDYEGEIDDISITYEFGLNSNRPKHNEEAPDRAKTKLLALLNRARVDELERLYRTSAYNPDCQGCYAHTYYVSGRIAELNTDHLSEKEKRNDEQMYQ